MNPIALENLQWKYYIIYCCFLAFEVVILYVYVVETRYTPLEEIAKFFDGEDVVAVVNTEMEKKGGIQTREVEVAA